MTRVGEKVAWMGCDGTAGVTAATVVVATPEGERENREWGWGTVKVLTLDKPSPRRPAPRSWTRPPPPRHRLAASRGPSNDYQNDTESSASDCRGGRWEGRARRAFKFSPHGGVKGRRKECSMKVALLTREMPRDIRHGVFNPCVEFTHDSFFLPWLSVSRWRTTFLVSVVNSVWISEFNRYYWI